MMAGLFDWRPWRRSQAAEVAGAVEAKSPVPRDELNFVEPIGFGGEVVPMDKKDRKDPAAIVSASMRAAQETSRAARYADFDLMDNGDLGAMLDAVVDAVLTFEDVSTGRGFKVESDDATVQELLDRAKRQADLEQLAEEILRDMLKYGDGFVEPLFAGPELVGAQTYKPAEITVNRDDKGRLPRGKDEDGFPIAFQQKKNGTIVAGWQPWEMVHFKFWPSRKLKYSEKGLLDLLRSDWRKLQLVEQGMVVARITRAYPRRVHYVDVTNKDRKEQEETLKQYIVRMTKKVFGRKQTNADNLPIVDVSDDIYMTTGYETGPDGRLYPKLNRTEIEDPAMAGLAELGDVQYLRQKQWSQVPSDVVGIKRNMTGDMDSQDLAFTKLLRRCQRQLERGLRGIFDQVLLANGKLPAEVEYRVLMPVIDIKASWRYADARFRSSMELRNYAEMGAVSRRFMLKRAFSMTDKEIDAEWQNVEEEMSNPIFVALAAQGAARDGLPSVSGEIAGNVNKAGNDGGSATPTAPKAADPDEDDPAVTKNGINRGTKLGQKLRGNMSGG
jgi:hypothetical protein